MKSILKEEFNIPDIYIDFVNETEKSLKDKFEVINKTVCGNFYRVQKAFSQSGLQDSFLSGSTGYGYGDRGREITEKIYADTFKCEDALVRCQIVSGTHALSICMFGILRPGDRLLSITGKPYDTLLEIIGAKNKEPGSLADFNINYSQVDFIEGSKFDEKKIERALTHDVKMVLIQRSRGYSLRPALSVEEIGKICKFLRLIKKDICILVDNCYGEFTEISEPCQNGADLMAGSLIKNPGGGLAHSGGYICGKKEYVELCAARLTVPGQGKDVGPSLGQVRNILQGFYIAPSVVGESLKGATLCGAVYEKLGYKVSPGINENRSDIIQAVIFNDRDKLLKFMKSIQSSSPVDSFITPQPWDMPGYDCPVVMAAGGFVQGASIELSADSPVKPPYVAYVQGGLVYAQVKLAVLKSLEGEDLCKKDLSR